LQWIPAKTGSSESAGIVFKTIGVKTFGEETIVDAVFRQRWKSEAKDNPINTPIAARFPKFIKLELSGKLENSLTIRYDNSQAYRMTRVMKPNRKCGYFRLIKITMEPHYYNVDVSWNGDRKGVMCSPELKSPGAGNGCIEVATPPQFPKGIEGIWSPEHLFTAAVASCFMTTFLAIAENSKLNFNSFACKAKGKLDRVEGGLAMTEVHIFPTVAVAAETERERALRVLNKTENACLITQSIKSKVVMHASVEVVAETANP
jgi:organic hydroperoxide reductase OsmC/OhrA